MSKLKAMFGALAIGAIAASGALAQESSTNQVAVNTAWNVFVEDDPKECWSVSTPEDVVNTREGRVVAATRSQIVLMVFYRPSDEAKGQVAYTGGYPFRSGSTVTLQIGESSFSLFTDGEWAWPASESDDAKSVTAMKRGAQAVVSGVSGRGTATKDTFSLLGFTASVEDAEARCAQ